MNKNDSIIPIISYPNAEKNKQAIYKDNKNKSEIYRWVKNINNKTYIGSGVNLTKRLRSYFNKNELNRNSRPIQNALLKYGHKNFSLYILEYCERSILILREQYYIDNFKPEYNILKVAGSRLGSKHSEKTRIQMSINNTGINHPFFGKRHSFESRKKIGETLRSLIRENIKPKVIKAETRLKLSFRCQGVCVKVFDCSNKYIREFPNITSTAKYFNISNRTVSRYLDKNIFYLGYTFKSYIKDK